MIGNFSKYENCKHGHEKEWQELNISQQIALTIRNKYKKMSY